MDQEPWQTHRSIVCLLASTILILLAMTSCGSPPKVTWNLRHSHTKADVGWKDDTTSTHWTKRMDLTILLPGNRTFHGQPTAVSLEAKGDVLQLVSINYPNMTINDGVRQAKELAREWDIPTGPIQSWYEQVRKYGQTGVSGPHDPYPFEVGGPPLSSASSGPTPGLAFVYSFDQSRPLLIMLEFGFSV